MISMTIYPPASLQSCQNCYYARKHNTIKDAHVLRCHAESPKLNAEGFGRTAWPVVQQNDWCGYWGPIKEEQS
jgi:hypothetical protein